MRKILAFIIVSLFIFGCNESTTSKENKDATENASAEKIEYAYIPKSHAPDYWDRGDQKNVALVLNALKAFENKKIDDALTAFGDSIRWSFDGFDAKISKDSVKSVFTEEWNNLTSLQIKMDDYESVISKDKKYEYVTLWYKQIMTNTKGITDSMAVVDDLRIENGKITELDEKTRKFPVKK